MFMINKLLLTSFLFLLPCESLNAAMKRARPESQVPAYEMLAHMVTIKKARLDTTDSNTKVIAQKCPRPEHLQLVKNLESPTKKQAELAPLVTAVQQITEKQIIRKSEDFEIEKKYICNQCGNGFEKKNGLAQHKNIVHLDKRPYSCKQCEKNFKTKGHLKEHINFVHSDIRAYSCNKCNKTYKRKSQLESHVTSKHSTIKAHICEICEKSFSLPETLRYHLKTHSNETQYACTVCGSKFKMKHNLTDHMKCHSDERPYICEECGDGFKRKNNLDAHTRTHSNKRAYICICNKTFKYQSGLTKHQKKSCPGKSETS